VNTFRITVIFKSGKPWRKYGLTFEEAMEIKDEFMAQLVHDTRIGDESE